MATENGFHFNRAGIYASYVLLILLVTYLLNQLDRYALAVCTQPMAQDIGYGDYGCLERKNVSDSEMPKNGCPKNATRDECDTYKGPNNTEVCYYERTGQGLQYQILAGPIFIVIYTFAGIGLGYLADITNRKMLLAFCLAFWSLMTLLTGFATEYWQLVVLRFGLGFGEAGCTPFATSIIADYFVPSVRGVALGVYNIGIYAGYSMSYAFGDFITAADINGKGWRWVFWIASIPGFVVALLMVLTVREPERRRNESLQERVDSYEELSGMQKLKMVAKCFCSPSLLLICLAGSIRNGAGYVWGYNTQPYFNQYFPSVSTGQWLSWIPLVGGSFAVIFGGFISDRVVKRSGTYARIWVLIASLLLAAPFAAATLFLSPPWAFVMQIPTYIIGEMWVSVTLAVVVELVPSSIRTTAIAFYFFIISNIGGNMPLLVPPISQSTSLRVALYILYPGGYVLAAAIFLISMVVVKRDIQRRQEAEGISVNPLLADDTKED
ncbi:MFS-type efflux pump MSMEG_3705-like [Diadema setosum]|uniref:MFS-type efflux pump MSMEG_3705-like n=1 Tax=Diadema setosum TaxID=31175 RepID=UPI003B3BBFDC